MIQQLLDEMKSLVHSYHPSTRQTGGSIAELIPGTAFFPGGTGLWRGDDPFGELPDHFPEHSVMFVAHNFDSIRAHDAAKIKGGEARSFFWQTLLAYLECAGVRPQQAFFTNALMGLKAGSATGDMPTVPGYEDECRQFLVRQIEIVKPSVIVALGQKAGKRVRAARPAAPSVVLLHPSARELKPRVTRQKMIAVQAKALSDLHASVRVTDVVRLPARSLA
ncbi:MAG: uracil-DNA glycosylase family protein [Bryobacteraceae bacterium]